jgi:hypothetical protein
MRRRLLQRQHRAHATGPGWYSRQARCRKTQRTILPRFAHCCAQAFRCSTSAAVNLACWAFWWPQAMNSSKGQHLPAPNAFRQFVRHRYYFESRVHKRVTTLLQLHQSDTSPLIKTFSSSSTPYRWIIISNQLASTHYINQQTDESIHAPLSIPLEDQ